MDASKDDKSIVEKTVDVVKEFAASVSAAAHKAVKPKSAKADDEIIMVPSAPTGFMDDAVAPRIVLVRKQKRSRKNKAKPDRKRAKKPSKSARSPARRKSVAKKTSSSKKKKTKNRRPKDGVAQS